MQDRHIAFPSLANVLDSSGWKLLGIMLIMLQRLSNMDKQANAHLFPSGMQSAKRASSGALLKPV